MTEVPVRAWSWQALLAAGLALATSSLAAAQSSGPGRPGPSAAPLAPSFVSQSALITFESDVPESKPNGFVSVESSLVVFSDSDGANLEVYDAGAESDGQALGVFGDDDSYLIMDFALPMKAVGLLFGNDDDGFSCPGDEAVLTMFKDGAQVAEVRVVMNRNDLGDQTIEYAGGAIFDRATFFYDVSPAGTCGNSQGLIEVVDNIAVTTASTQDIPTLGVAGFAALALLLGGAAFFALRRRRAA